MGKILWTTLKIILGLLVIAALGAGAWFLCRKMGWPDWMAAVLLVSVLAVVAGTISAVAIVNRRREKGFIKRVVEQDEGLLKGAAVSGQVSLEELEERFAQAIGALKHSHLKKRGRPVYVLPWYLMLGEPGSGKTMALRNSRLPVSFTDVGHPGEEGPTKSCDFWFFDQCVILDTAGRFAAPGAQARSREEWKRLISLLAKYRRREPLNGLIVAIPADKLTREHADYMEQYGSTIYLAVEQLMRVLGYRFPIYILVTKADQVMGMDSFSRRLPWKAYRQAMGSVNADLSRDHLDFLEDTLASVTERLKDLRLLILHSSKTPDHELMLLPDELPSIRPGLAAFIRNAFQVNPYLETPILRGIYFSSSRQVGKVKSRSLQDAGAGLVEAEMAGANRGLFLQDFFSQVIPADRWLFKPIKEFIRWQRSTRSIGFAAIAALTCAVLGLLTFSYFKNYSAISSFKEQFGAKPPAIEEESRYAEKILSTEHFREELVRLEGLNKDWWIPWRMFLSQSLEAESGLKDTYNRNFKEHLLGPIDTQMLSRVAVFGPDTPDLVISEYVEHVVKRINLINARTSGASLEEMSKMPQPSTAVVMLLDKTILPSVAANFNTLYLHYLTWTSLDSQKLRDERTKLEGELISLLNIKGDNMEWLAAWANAQQDLQPVTFVEFWPDRVKGLAGVGIQVNPAFTVKGKAKIDDFIGQISKAIDSPGFSHKTLEDPRENFKVRRENFDKWYPLHYYKEWETYARKFMAEENSMRRLEEVTARPREVWHDLAVLMTTFNNPYFQLLGRMVTELEPWKGREDAPAWVGLVYDFDAMKLQVESEGFVEEGISLTKAVEQVATNIIKNEPTIGQPGKTIESHMKAVEELRAYKNAMINVAQVLDSENHAYQMTGQLFAEGPGAGGGGQSAFTEGFLAVKRLEANLGVKTSIDDVFWQLTASPLEFLLYYACRETACSLQTTWEETVLAEVQGVPDNKMQAELFKQDGVVWKFIDGPANPFIGRREANFYPRSAYDEDIPFIPSFMTFLQAGALGKHTFQDKYEVGLVAFPTDVNEDAIEKPEAVIIEMVCSDGLMKLANYNYPVSSIFKWAPDTCGGVKMDIVFRTLTVTRIYPNFTGFPTFLQDFRRGTKMLFPDDFPNYVSELSTRSVQWIKIRFELAGHEPVIDLIEKTPLTAPGKIVYCWK